MERRLTAEGALRAAPPHGLLDSLRTILAQRFATADVDLLLVDLDLEKLRSVSRPARTGGDRIVLSSLPGTVFTTQQPYLSGGEGPTVTAYVPVTARDDRWGVLVVELPPRHSGPEVLEELTHLARALGHALAVAQRQTDVYRAVRRDRPLTLAAEMESHLMSARACTRDEFDLHAYWPASYSSAGHLFDWSVSATELTMTVANGTGSGVEHALVNTLALGSLRNARRAGADLAGQASLVDQALYAQYRGAYAVPALLTSFDLATGGVRAVDAGSPTVWRLRGGEARRLSLDEQLPLGMFEGTVYQPERFALRAGDRLIVIAHGGGHTVAVPDGRAIGRAIVDTRRLPCSQAPEAVLGTLAGDDVTFWASGLVACVDWRG
ncbi:PP2C family protein-serine/threonine phosphatase [Streptomyces sp. NPDC088387]|uniref:PP2C family protein-serine/threonine phosphatase n=1 Tax=Streptomyces sp. NPDC088387 TaxID=3365859 RepID=UPI00382AF98F